MIPIQKYISDGTNVNNVPLVEMTKIIGTVIFFHIERLHFTLLCILTLEYSLMSCMKTGKTKVN